MYFKPLVVGYMHAAGLYGLYLCFNSTKRETIITATVFFIASSINVISCFYKLVQILLTPFKSIWNYISCRRSLETNSDSDAGKHKAPKEVSCTPEKNSKTRSNPETEHFTKYISALCHGLLISAPMYLWEETFTNSWHTAILLYILNLYVTYFIRRVTFGYRPYEKGILATQNILVALFTFGEGFHNYHHVFSWDYRTAELGNNALNFTTWFIDFFAWIGWAYDLKTVSKDMIERRAKRTGDGTNLWGWEDKYGKEEDEETAVILSSKTI